MPPRPFRLAFCLALLCTASAPLALAADPAPAAPAAAAQKEDHTPLEDQMSALRGAFNKLRKQINDPAANASSLELTAKLLSAAEKSIALEPARVGELPEADRARFIADYQDSMREFVAEARKLETALKAGDNVTAAEILKDLGARQKDGHKHYRAQKKE